MDNLTNLLLTSNSNEFLKLNDLTRDIYVYKKNSTYIYYIPTITLSYIVDESTTIKKDFCDISIPYMNFDIKKTIKEKSKSLDHQKEIQKFYDDNDPKLNLYLKAPNFTILDSYIFEKYIDSLIIKKLM